MAQWELVDMGWFAAVLVIVALAYFFYTHYSTMLKTTGSKLGADIKAGAQTVEKSNVSNFATNVGKVVKTVEDDLKNPQVNKGP